MGGEPFIGRLFGLSSTAAANPSLSRVFGRDNFPLHTDGAHLAAPPDAVFLEFDCDMQAAPTLVHRPNVESVEEPVRSALRHGVFEIDFGRSSFLGVVATFGRVRFDPVAMRPRDHLAAVAAEYLGGCLERSKGVALPGLGATLVSDPAHWWERYWATAEVLVVSQDRELDELVGSLRLGEVQAHLDRNKESVKRRVSALLDAARQRFDLGQAPAVTLVESTFSVEAQCPACRSPASIHGDEVAESEVVNGGDDDDPWPLELVTVWTGLVLLPNVRALHRGRGLPISRWAPRIV